MTMSKIFLMYIPEPRKQIARFHFFPTLAWKSAVEFHRIYFDVALNDGFFCNVEYISDIDDEIFLDLDHESPDCPTGSQPRYFYQVCASVVYAEKGHFEQK